MVDEYSYLPSSLLEEALMLGVANETWVPCIFEAGYFPESWRTTGSQMQNIDDQNQFFHYALHLPCVKGSLKLYVSGIKIVLTDADANDFLNDWDVVGRKSDGNTVIDNNIDDLTSPNTYTHEFTGVDCSGFTQLSAALYATLTDAGELEIESVSLQVYYDT